MRYLAGISFAYGLMVLAFYPLVLYIFSLFFAAYVLVQSAWPGAPGGFRQCITQVASLAAFIALGIGIGAIQLIPALDFVERSFRAQSSIEFCGMFSFPPENLATIIAPGFYGNELDPASPRRYWGRCFYWEMFTYIGLLPLIMAAVGAAIAPVRQRIALLGCGAIFLAIGLGRHTPLFPLLYKYAPYFDVFRGSSKYMIIPLFCGATLSAYGFHSIFCESDETRRKQLRRIGMSAATFLLLIVVGTMGSLMWRADQLGSNWESFLKWLASKANTDRYVPFEANAESVKQTSLVASSSLQWAAAFLALSIAFLYASRAPRFRRYLFPAAAAIAIADLAMPFSAMMQTFDRSITQFPDQFDKAVKTYPYPYPPRILHLSNPWPNMAMYHEYSAVYGYTGNTLRRYNDFLNRIQGLPSENSMATQIARVHSEHFGMLAIDAAVVTSDELPPGTKPITQWSDKALVPYSLVPRAFLTAGTRQFPDREQALSYVLSKGPDALSFPAIESTEPAPPDQPLATGETAEIKSFDPLKIEIDVSTSYPRTLVLCEMYSKHWQAYSNGKATQVMPANYVFRAVHVPAGTTRVVFKYDSPPFRYGAYVSAAALTTLVILLMIGRTLAKSGKRLDRTAGLQDPATS